MANRGKNNPMSLPYFFPVLRYLGFVKDSSFLQIWNLKTDIKDMGFRVYDGFQEAAQEPADCLYVMQFLMSILFMPQSFTFTCPSPALLNMDTDFANYDKSSINK